MLIYFFTSQPPVCEKIADKLEQAGYQCIVLTNTKMFFHLLHSNDELPDLFIMDYVLFQHDVLNIYRYMKKNNRITPLIFYNDPYPNEQVRANFWIYQCHAHFPDLNLSKVKTAFHLVAAAVDSPELKPYIPLIQTPLPFHEKEIAIKTVLHEEKTQNAASGQFNIYEFRKKTNMNPTIFHLFEYLYQRLGLYVSSEELRHIILSNGKTAKPGSVSSYISRLRSYLVLIKEINIDLIATHKCYKLIVY